MIAENFSFVSEDETQVFVYKWEPIDAERPKGIVQIAHGMAETAARYERLAKFLTAKGYIVYANDHRGHGRTAGSLEKVGVLARENGFERMVADMHQMSLKAFEENPGLPLFLLGHSMGSFAAQRYLMLHGNKLSGAILSGSNGRDWIIHQMGFAMAAAEVRRKGREAKSERMDKLSFGNYNKRFKPNRTQFDWLSRDAFEVDKYINDPYCGEVFSAGFYYDFLQGLLEIGKNKNIALIPKYLPIYLFSGDQDPVGNAGKGLKKLKEVYQKHGISEVDLKLYPGGRHEMLNEINRDQVMSDLLVWIEKINKN
ncbi:lysophospholipase [Eubacteriaceae bacterium ES3]|nr:lysophospholipase [Eubacteriaceae bacterium ES3]